MLKMRSELKDKLEGSSRQTKVYPELNRYGQVAFQTVSKIGPTPWAARTRSYDEFGLENIHSNTPETTLQITNMIWRLNELATDAYRSARTLYWGLYSMTRIHTAGSKHPSNVALENALKALVEADARAGAVPDVSPGSLYIRKEVEGSRILVGKWLRRFVTFRALARKAPSSEITVGQQ
jgi:hypothetical protein